MPGKHKAVDQPPRARGNFVTARGQVLQVRSTPVETGNSRMSGKRFIRPSIDPRLHGESSPSPFM